MRDRDFLAERFEQERPQLRRIAYHILGTRDDADDAVQEAWVRLSRTDESSVDNLGAWLTTVVSRVALDMLRARRSRREEYVGSWMPEPIVTLDERPSPEDEALIADGVGLALYVVLETLSPAERLAFVLHDMFSLPYDEIAAILGRTPDATRQLASRARRRIRVTRPEPDVELVEHQRLVAAFFAAARDGNFDALVEFLDPDVTLRVDAGPGSPLARPPIVGRDAVLGEAHRWSALMPLGRPAIVNGAAGAVIGRPGRPFAVVGINVAKGRITALDFVLDPAKLARITIP
jgi:RNA polymerase sigma-70 factor (ECF subfamily)